MSFTVRNKAGLYYHGYEKDQPIWRPVRRDDARLDAHTAEQVVKQLTILGHADIRMEAWEERRSKKYKRR